ncbi:MAG: hypothetical protein HYZ46_06710 [Nitrosomonadales bacterium]|nr:hypothetical protein [Nitrosomonadales bacterium]
MSIDNHENAPQKDKPLSPIAKFTEEHPLTFLISLIYSISFITGIFFGEALFFTKFKGGVFSYKESPSLFIINFVFSSAIFSISASWLWHHYKPNRTQHSIQNIDAPLLPFAWMTLPPHRIVALAFFAPFVLAIVAGVILWDDLHKQSNVIPWIFYQPVILKIFGVGLAALLISICLWRSGASMSSRSQAIVVAVAVALTIISWGIIQMFSMIVAFITSIWWWTPQRKSNAQ